MTLFLILMIGHVIFDFYCQPESWVQDKFKHKHKSSKLFLHAGLHGLIASVLVGLYTLNGMHAISVLFFVFITHWIIDWAKICLGGGPLLFILDQFSHAVVLAITAFTITQAPQNLLAFIGGAISAKHIAIFLAYFIILKPVSIFIGLTLQQLPFDQSKNKGITSGGESIGYTERILMLTFILLGQYAVVGIVLAAKSIFRFGELSKTKDVGLTEYVLLGSLLSVTITALIGIMVKLNFL